MLFISFDANKLFINHMADPLDVLGKTTAYYFDIKMYMLYYTSFTLVAEKK